MMSGSHAKRPSPRPRRRALRLAVALAALLPSGCGDDTVVDSSAPGTPTTDASAELATAAATPPCGQPNGTVVTHSGNVAANQSWAGGGVTHRVPFSFSITGSAILTIRPCAIVALGSGVSITVRDNARLLSAGTSDTSFVVFRRANPIQPWGALRGYTPTSLIDLRWTRLQGGGAFGGLNDPTIAVFGNGYGALPKRVLRTIQVVIQSSKGTGVHLDANGAFTTDSKGLQITGSGGRPVVTTMMSLGSRATGSASG